MNKLIISIIGLLLIGSALGIYFFNSEDDGCNNSVALGLKFCDDFNSLDKEGCYEQCYMDYGILSGEDVECDEKHNKVKLICDGDTKAIKFVNQENPAP